MANRLREFWDSVAKYVSFGNLEETPLSQEQLDIFDINNQPDEKPIDRNLNDIDSISNDEHKQKQNASRNKESIESPEVDEKEFNR